MKNNKFWGFFYAVFFGVILCVIYKTTESIPIIYSISILWLWTKEKK